MRRLALAFALFGGFAGDDEKPICTAGGDWCVMSDAQASAARVYVETSEGSLVLSLFPDQAPKTVQQFLKLAEAGVLDGTYFYGITRGFVAQTSAAHDRALPLTPEQAALIRKIPLEAGPVRHRRGALSMARDAKDPNSAESSFCILFGPAAQLDGQYTVFGQVEAGDDVLSAIESAAGEQPVRPARRIDITRAVVYREGKSCPAAAASGGEAAPSCHPAVQNQPEKSGGSMAMNSSHDTRQNEPVEVSERQHPGGGKEVTVLFRGLEVNRIYPSMTGPWNMKPIKLAPQSPEVWLTSYRAEVLDGASGRADQEFMCHTNLDLIGTSDAPPELRGNRAQLSISQGQTELRFPAPFALRLPNDPHRQINLTAMVLNANYPDLKKRFDFKSTVRYLDAEAARTHRLKPLFQGSVYTVCPVELGAQGAGNEIPLCEPATGWEVHAGPNGQRQTGHWIIPKGRSSITHDVTAQLALPYDTTVHYIWMHLHPFGEHMVLKDRSTGKTVWEGRARSHPIKMVLLATDHYSSSKGIPLYKDHRYELTTTYNNPTGRRATAMAAFWMYLASR